MTTYVTDHNDDGTVKGTPVAATIADYFTTPFSSTKKLVGTGSYIQTLGLVALGGAIDRRVSSGAWGLPFVKPGV